MKIHLKIIVFFTLIISFSIFQSASPFRVLQDHGLHSIWYDLKNRDLNENMILDHFQTSCNQHGGLENSKIPQKTDNLLRLATYNVHFWQQPKNYDWKKEKSYASFSKIINVIKLVNADILILQEVGKNEPDVDHSHDLKILQDLGYTYSIYGNTGPLYNCIFSKIPFVSQNVVTYTTNPIDNYEKRCFVRIEIALTNNKKLSIYDTHLEVRNINIKKGNKIIEMDEEDAREAQLKEILEYSKANDKDNNVVIGMDSNSVRKKDLLDKLNDKTLWKMHYNRMLKKAQKKISTKALDFITSANWLESFEKGNIKAPKFTSGFGTRIDFFFLNPTWNLPIAGCYVFYSCASDHCPVIMDIALSTKKQ